jgi:flagellar biogenesis protein FliO
MRHRKRNEHATEAAFMLLALALGALIFGLAWIVRKSTSRASAKSL